MAIAGFSQVKSILIFEGHSRRAYWRRFSALLAMSVIIATMGLIRNSGAVVIAAMLIAPLMTPILGIAAAMMMGWTRRAATLFGIVAIAALASVALAWGVMFIAEIPRGIALPNEVVARTDPGIEELIVALVAGAAGAYVQINRNEISLLPGAAIGVALVPPLSASGILLYFGEYRGGYEAGLLFLTNLAAIILAACCVYFFAGSWELLLKSRKRFSRFTASFGVTLAVLVAIFIQLSSETFNRFTETRLEERVADVLRVWAEGYSVEVIRLDVNHGQRLVEVWTVLDVPFNLSRSISTILDPVPEELKERNLAALLRESLGSEYDVAFRYQLRFAGRVDLRSGVTTDALPLEDTLEDQ